MKQTNVRLIEPSAEMAREFLAMAAEYERRAATVTHRL